MSKRKKKKGLSARMIKDIKKSNLSEEALATMYKTTVDKIREVKNDVPI